MNQPWEFVASDFFFLFRWVQKHPTVPVWRGDHARLGGGPPQRRHHRGAAQSGGGRAHHLPGQRSKTRGRVVRSRDLALTELDCVCVCVCVCSRSSRCTGSVFRPSWRAGSTECWHKASPSHWWTCTTTAFLRSVWRADAPIKAHFKEPF